MPAPVGRPPRLGRAGRAARLAWLTAAALCAIAFVFADQLGYDRRRAATAMVLLLVLAGVASAWPLLRDLGGSAYRAANDPSADPRDAVTPETHRADEENLQVLATGRSAIRELTAEEDLIARADELWRESEGAARLLAEGRGPLKHEREEIGRLADQMRMLLDAAGR